jgi:hypothetical protein
MPSISLQSYLFESGYHRPGRRLIPLEHFTGRLERGDLVEGAVELTVDEAALFTREMRTLIDLFWCELIDALEAMTAGRPFAGEVPDLAVRYEFLPLSPGQWVRLCVHGPADRPDLSKAVSVPTGVLAGALWRGAWDFFTTLQPLHPGGIPARELGRLEAIRDRLPPAHAP